MALPALSFWTRRITPSAYSRAVRSALTGTMTGIENHLTAVSATLAPRADAIAELALERDNLERAFAARWQGSAILGQGQPGVVPPANLLARLRTGRKAWWPSGRDAQRLREAQWVGVRLAQIEHALLSEIRGLTSAWTKALPARVTSPSVPPPRLFAAIDDSPTNIARVQPGEGPLIMQVGEASWSATVVIPVVPGESTSGLRFESVAALPPVSTFPALIDFVEDGGFATDHRATAESAVARLLALLPAGQLKVHLFDPVQVGASLTYLSDLADATRAVIADVRVVTADLEPLLDDLTRHIARVTQQYLGSRHSSLAAYNAAAGEVAEGYHLLVLMDFPAGRIDDDTMRKLETIVQAGPACGVFTLIVSPDPGRFSFGLPLLRHDVWSTPDQAIPGLRKSLPILRPLSNAATVDALGSRDWRMSVRIDPFVGWQGTSWSTATARDVQQLVARLDRDISGAAPRSISPATTAKRVRGLQGRSRDANPDDPSTWWRKSAVRGVEAVIGVSGDRDVAAVVLESAGGEPGLLIGGQPGTGKSVVLHALICDLVRNYSPAELELYLLDPKQGVEFTVYAAGKLPHAKVVTVKAPAESTILVLEDLVTQIADRGELFRKTRSASGANVDKLDDYLAAPGVTRIPRVVAVIDEFQALLNTGDDEMSMRASRLLDRVIREGRAFGLHLVLATQSLQGITHLPAAVSNMLESKIVLRVSEDDSRLFLGPHNLDAAKLGKTSGKAILKRPDVEKVVQITNEDKDSVAVTVRTAAAKAPNTRRSTILDFSRARPPSKLSAKVDRPAWLDLLVARGMGVDESVTARLHASDDGNLLVVAGSGRGIAPAPSIGILSTVIAGCVVAKVPFDVVDFGEVQTPFDLALSAIRSRTTGPGRRYARRNLFDAYLEEALALARRPGSTTSTRRVLILANAHRNRELTDGGDAAYRLADLLGTGASSRVHVVLHAETGAAASKIVSNGDMLRQFGSRLLARTDSDSSYHLLGSNIAEKLASDSLILWENSGELTGAVPFAPYGPKGWAQIVP